MKVNLYASSEVFSLFLHFDGIKASVCVMKIETTSITYNLNFLSSFLKNINPMVKKSFLASES